MSYIYYSPEDFGLKVVGEITWREPCYDFDFSVVWKKGDKYYFASDSGCSCPAPFENVTSLDDLDGPFGKSQLRAHVMTQIANRVDDYTYPESKLIDQAIQLFERL